MYQAFFKRAIEFSLAMVLSLLLSPLIAVVVVVLFITNRGKVLFRQARPGYKGKIFTIYKFCTMTDERHGNGDALPDKDRLTRIGRLLRKTSIDELPQLANVLKGELSLVGPRPLLVEYLPLYSKEQQRRHDVKPGIAGWAQVNGRNSISWEEKFALDLWYVDNISLMTDLKILLLSVVAVLRPRDVNASGDLPMGRFQGDVK